jgi:hypothetical protein
MAKKRKKKVVEVDRRVVGISLKGSTRVGAPMCHVVYQIWWSDGTTTHDRGTTLWGAAFQCDPETGEIPENNRQDLYSRIVAAAALVEDLEYACVCLDGHEKKLYKT